LFGWTDLGCGVAPRSRIGWPKATASQREN
jgi:hypothetical protein